MRELPLWHQSPGWPAAPRYSLWEGGLRVPFFGLDHSLVWCFGWSWLLGTSRRYKQVEVSNVKNSKKQRHC